MTPKIKTTKNEPQSSGEIRLFNTAPMEFLDWVKFTYLLPKPEININDEVTKAKVKLHNEAFCLSINVNPILNGIQLIYKYWDWNGDNFEALHKFEYGINELSKELTYKKIIIPKEIAKLPKSESKRKNISTRLKANELKLKELIENNKSETYIANHFNRHVRTIQRWKNKLGL